MFLIIVAPRRPSTLRLETYSPEIQLFCQNRTCVPVEYINDPWTVLTELAIQPLCILPLGTNEFAPGHLLVYIAFETPINDIEVCTLRLCCYYIGTVKVLNI